ncbi:hypothetical protein B0A52_09360 [Exophiala mesophila]|uniref:FAD-binding FR-type domain-containing protein n=1 Tax=Exophiala mesophila TaxID=212818 RepID=A0A438MUR1_EXOME|nr:hypothetical protein B0A52_09360 [Exophiala mesophila]
MAGINTAVSEISFVPISEEYYPNMCQNELIVNSWWAAAKLYCTPKEIEAGEKLYAGYCEEYGGVELVTYAETLPILTDEYIAALNVVTYDTRDASVVWETPVLISYDLYEAGYRSSSAFDMQYVLHKQYGWGVYGFWGALLLIGIANRFISHILASRSIRKTIDIEGEAPASSPRTGLSRLLSPFVSVHHWFRANLIIPAAFGSHHQRLYYWCSIPTRMETIILTLFWILNFVLCCVSYDIFEQNLYYTKPIQAWRYISDRTGIICYANLPLLWMFSGRNNVFLWLTGWSFSSFNIFHRHIARIATIQAIVHSIGWSAIEIHYGYFAYSWQQQYWYMGGMATITMSLLLVFSSVWARLNHYEIFLFIHIALSVLTLVGLFYHTAIFINREYDGYLWPCVAIWLFDRFARLGRLAYCNIRARSGVPKASRAIATYNKESDMLRIEAFPGSRLLKPGPGQHYYIYQFNKLRFWENHPFTLAASYAAGEEEGDPVEGFTNKPSSDPDVRPTLMMEKSEGSIGSDNMPSSSGSTSPTPTSLSDTKLETSKPQIAPGQHKLVFFIRPFNGWTKRLRDECVKAGPQGITNTRILVEGPYGECSPLRSFENVIFVVGGTGIAGAVPYLQEHLRLTSPKQSPSPDSQQQTRETRTRHITVIWATKQSGMIRDIAARELRPFLHREDITFKFYATRDKKAKEALVASEKLKAIASPSSIDFDDIEIFSHRPNIQEDVSAIVDQVNAAGSRGGKIAILTCGPAAMADEARAAAHRALKQGKKGLEYIEEAFGW